MQNIIKIIFLLIVINFNLYAKEKGESKVLFKLNDKVFTNIDLERRIQYLEIINNFRSSDLNDFEMKEIFDDYISALIFNEYYIENDINFKISEKEINLFYSKNIENYSLKNNFNEEEIIYLKYNAYIDLVRKRIIEDSLNLKKNILLEQANSLDLLYNYNFSYLVINEIDFDLNYINNIYNRNDFNNLKNLLTNNNINFFYKNENIDNNSILSNLLKVIINTNKNIHIEKNNEFYTIISMEKNLESYEGIFVKLVSFDTKNKLNKKDLNCKDIDDYTKDNKTIYKEYEYIKLNNQIKNNLKSINDYIIFNNENSFNYIFLCELRYNEELLNSINFNKKINFLAKKIQLNFIRKYKNEYNYQKIQ